MKQLIDNSEIRAGFGKSNSNTKMIPKNNNEATDNEFGITAKHYRYGIDIHNNPIRFIIW